MGTRVQLTLDFNQDLEKALAQECPGFSDFRILSQSLDARNANRGRVPRYQYHLDVIKPGEKFDVYQETFQKLDAFKEPPIIIGAGPAGLFCALRLSEYGIPCVLLERGDRAHNRMKHIARHWRYGEFDPENNVCFGEGGAGLFSDGKLITRIKSPYVQYVMNRLVDFGAPPDTAYLSNPHLGSNKIRQLIGKITDLLRARGCEIHYNTRVDELLFDGNQINGVKTSDGQTFHSRYVVLATGHSAKEVYHHLKEKGIEMAPKDFAVGVRVEHPRRLIDSIQYGGFADDPRLGAARYRLSWEDPSTKKGTYSFCMCPGGYVLSSGTEQDGIVVNGMSNFARNSPWSNAALVVAVKAGEDYCLDDALNGLHFQRAIESKAFEASRCLASGKEVPAQTLKDFLDNRVGHYLPKTSCPSGIFATDLREILPDFVSRHIAQALERFDQHMKGFVGRESLLFAPETRTSAPVTILRDRQSLVAVGHQGAFIHAGGAGYAGGITSAAVDGVRVAMSLLKTEKGLY